MIPHSIRCEAAVVNTKSGVCPGMAKTEQGEVCVMDGRTPGIRGICCQAFTAMSPFRAAMMMTDKLESEHDGYLEVKCPHGVVTFRLSRMS
jgi:uncharacterized repeat protein (TIGR04076 family)